MESLENTLTHWLKDHNDVFASTPTTHGVILTEKATHKVLTILYPEVAQWQLKKNAEFFDEYINIVTENGAELILCHAGFAFSPSFEETPLGNTPSVVCLQDFYRMVGHLKHVILAEDETHYKESVQTLIFCLAILKGAQEVGLDISDEEQLLEPLLEALEKERMSKA